VCEFHLDPDSECGSIMPQTGDRYGQRLFERNFPVKGVAAEGGLPGAPHRSGSRAAFDRKILFEPFAAVTIDGPDRSGSQLTMRIRHDRLPSFARSR
jgi:hypothetical protein